ncbi:MAG: ABC transporter substrate-binding protein [Nitrospirae bacterium]|nr:MAG: ABC transporter substrate-binding protein [Nitrospirota bacterium]
MKRLFIAAIVLFIFSGVAFAGEPTEILKAYTERIKSVLKDPTLNQPEKKKKRYEMLKSIVLEIFDIEELSKRTLARHWRRMTPEERKEFQDAFLKFLEQKYAGRIDKTIEEDFEVIYESEKVKGKYALVKSIIKTKTKGEYPVYYRLIKKNDKWMVYDVVIEGVSIVKNYRDQFREILSKKSYRELISMLREKAEKKETEEKK